MLGLVCLELYVINENVSSNCQVSTWPAVLASGREFSRSGYRGWGTDAPGLQLVPLPSLEFAWSGVLSRVFMQSGCRCWGTDAHVLRLVQVPGGKSESESLKAASKWIIIFEPRAINLFENGI